MIKLNFFWLLFCLKGLFVKKFLFKFFIFLTFLFIIFVIIAKIGINIEKVEFANLKLNDFSLKLDEKLILKVKNLELPKFGKNDTQNSEKIQFDELQNTLINFRKKISFINTFFQEIKIENISLNDQNITLLYDNDTYYVDNKNVRLNLNFTKNENAFDFYLNEFVLKNFDLSIQGKFNANFDEKIYEFNGIFATYEINGNLKLSLKDEILNYEIFNATAKSLQKFMDNFSQITDLHKEVKEWIYGKVVADEYFIENLSGKININTNDIFENEIYATGFGKNLQIKFDENLEVAKANEAHITLGLSNLTFHLDNPTYKDKNLLGSYVIISDIFGNNPILELDFTTQSPLDGDLTKILKAFDIELPIYQKSGKTEARVNIKYGLEDESIVINGDVEIANSKINLAGANFNSKSAKINITENKVTIKNANLSNEFLDITTNGNIDLNAKKGSFNTNINNFNLKVDNNEILKFKNQKDSNKLDLNANKAVLSSVFLNGNIEFANLTNIKISNLSSIIPFSPLLKDIGIKDGDVLITTKNFSDFDIKSENLKFDFGLLNKDKTPYNSDLLNIKVLNNTLNGQSGSKKLSFSVNNGKTNVNLNNIDFIFTSKSQNSQNNINLSFKGENSSIILKDINKTLDFISYNGDIKNGDISLNAKFNEGGIKLKNNKKFMQFFADNINSKTLNSLIGSESFDGGVFDFKASGLSLNDFKGEIATENTYLKEYAMYQNLLSFLNSIPSLLTFKTPDFSSKGFNIKNGKIVFRKMNDKIVLNAINFTGTSADIAGLGEIDLKSKKLKIDLELKYMKDASKIIDKIPIVNHIILGSDGSISTLIEISGTIDKPVYKTKVASDILSTPFTLIKNILTLPFALFD